MLMMLSDSPVMTSASMTPMSESGSDSMIDSGSRNDPNCTTSTKYISMIATPIATNICVKISTWSLGLTTLAQPVAGWKRHRGRDAGHHVANDFRQRPVLGIRFNGDDALPIEVIDARRTDRRRDPRHLPERNARARVARSGDQQRQ